MYMVDTDGSTVKWYGLVASLGYLAESIVLPMEEASTEAVLYALQILSFRFGTRLHVIQTDKGSNFTGLSNLDFTGKRTQLEPTNVLCDFPNKLTDVERSILDKYCKWTTSSVAHSESQGRAETVVKLTKRALGYIRFFGKKTSATRQDRSLLLESFNHLLNTRPITLGKTPHGDIRMVSINDVRHAYSQYTPLMDTMGVFSGRPHFAEVINDLETMSLNLRQQMLPAVLRFLFRSPQHRDLTKFNKRSTPTSKIRVGDILFCKKDFLETHNVSTSLLRVLDKNKEGTQLKCHKPLPAHQIGHRRPVVVDRTSRECFYLIATEKDGELSPAPDLQLLDIEQLGNVQKLHIGQVFEQNN